MDALFNASINLPVWVIVAYAVFACLVQTMPRPTEGKSSEVYIWVYQFFHLLCLNISLVLDPAKRLPILSQPQEGPESLAAKAHDAGK